MPNNVNLIAYEYSNQLNRINACIEDIFRGSVAKFKIKIIFPNNSIIYAGIPKSTLISMQTE
ncbi:hypothetical protein, partial [Enterococcus faecalis]|uniref:hypothetical protein n=1 Tax=Enterococcus faecalis TaxID=1351 RepID=UPI001F3D2693